MNLKLTSNEGDANINDARIALRKPKKPHLSLTTEDEDKDCIDMSNEQSESVAPVIAEPKVLLVKLSTGQDILGELVGVREEDGAFFLKHVVCVALVRDPSGSGKVGVQFVPFCVGSNEDAPVVLYPTHVVASLVPDPQILAGYNQTFSKTPQLVVPDKQLVVP